ncbi:phospholipase effector Tle1 domain-containing protein [Methylorubrum extorquens]|jgi:uncharacterized protein (DUF2235 family)|uniref:Peptidoglycan binding domain protein n=1 Tax=Methylorubrum extorquens (strain ATCC 14718 / DSM 1338 / JCM 2805 / NCIMB 9133 / AM1) TaxID=272630 RepID=C5B451_METEA|nr:DUF2235 domain-containing protein [Methylorubrum extorquens]MDV2988397.1 DUF2235 domain-containing protein [Methylobacteriaceae bacterium AG10]MRI57399.1 LysM peptidoglycan-binding domain-containing protein [Methylobacterium sp. DB1607]ACS43233.1 Peptidoglycan binding domain protein [Methylorubrum extorquens AM1]MCP1545680.1 uncharacterized protein (DUF2235 family) [Methylorubrum extorquens]MCP1591631.1 uncharacterized protein (DUF2235 family) [Methylorubrum extorquens]
MKRLIFCFDGTWNRLAPELATNVVLTAASIERIDKQGIGQIIHYDEGVGTGSSDELRGGMFGTGLIENVREAYRFLIFNYDPGDEVYVFGFSRGAYSARSFVGFIRHVGPLHRLHVGRIDEALALYEKRQAGDGASEDDMRRFRADYSDKVCIGATDDQWRCANKPGYVAGSVPRLRVKFLGVWDTVGALGVPEVVPFSGWLNREYDFHDPSIDDFVESARHAVALDERRELFQPVLFGDVTTLNEAAGFANDNPKAPYQERWFPGVHGSVGGGGDIRGLSDDALAWVLIGAKAAGLQLDTNTGTRIHGCRPDPLAPLINEANPEWSLTQVLNDDRDGPEHLWQLSSSALRRWRTPAEKLDGEAYRPGSLNRLEAQLKALEPWEFDPPTDLLAIEKVKEGDTLSKYAVKHYGKGKFWREILNANLDTVDNPDEIFPGQEIRIPRLAELGVGPSTA